VHVTIVSHYRLPVAGYGGTERIVVALVRGLAALGHRVTLLARPGSTAPEARLVVGLPAAAFRDPATELLRFVPDDTDVLHAHFPIAVAPAGVPFVQTLYGNLHTGDPLPPHTVCLSRNHAERHGGRAWVYCGLDPADFTFRREKNDYDLFIGRLHSIKGYRWAIAGAKRNRRRLLIAGGWRPSLSRFVRYVGEVDGARKRELLAGARCVWMPALWNEPFGLTLIEPLFSGTPVLGTRRGSLPEVLTPEVGALCDTLEEMIEASRTIGSRAPDTCRAHAERYFSHLVMADAYVQLYRHLMETRRVPVGKPTPWAPQTSS
jgi:glycosyltransferase involved in cell wall biosynthesis